MASDWDTYPISDFVTLSQGLAINAKSKYLLEETGLPLLRITDLINGTQVHFVNEEKAPPKCIATDHELIYTRTGQVGLVYRNKVGVVHNNCFKVIPSPELDKDFLYWFLFQESTKAHVNAVASGSVQKDLNHAAFLTLSIPKPELSEQKAIASILDSLDDKIELNRQMNETLEAMAQALFKSWFVDFDPVIDNALAAGNAIPDEFIERAEQRKGIEKKDNSDIQALFPDEFEFTDEMGWIPKGWKVESFGDLLDSTIGGDWGKPEQDDKHTRESVIIRGTDIPKLKIGERSEAPNRWVEEKKLKTRILRPFDIVIEISGGSPTQSTGRSIIITEQILERLGGVAEPASFCRKFSPSNKFLGLYAGIHLQKIYDDGKMWEYQNQSTGIANFQTTSFLEREQLVVPSESVLLKFYETLEPMISKMSSNQQIELAKLRDTLLPKLMSGELRISDAVDLVEKI
ncbi:restriction endonuclease subunit S [Psychrobacter alimentarius]|uniref:restriction endonuclease subunit S n=1 Tax=Psychrobacter alimentarius TaxID=261164 RepID=UPI003FD13AA0